jgi:predicted  nucleic acid-binding Zn-ribbon protein
MTATTALDALLTLQEHDGALDRLRHQRASLPERDALAQGEVDATALDGRVAVARAARDELVREEQRIDDEVRTLAAKATEVESKMYSGEISSPRELQSMQADVEQLRRHQRGLENRELELMEAREPLDAGVSELEARRDGLAAELDGLRRTLAEAEAVIDAEAGVELAARASVAGGIADALVSEYERCRVVARGVGVARLVGNTCQGCHLSIPATEVERIKKSGDRALEHCDNCGCILVP